MRWIELQPRLELFHFHFHVFEYLAQQSHANQFTGMNRHNRPATVGMPHKMMATANASYNKTRATQRDNHLTSAQSRQA